MDAEMRAAFAAMEARQERWFELGQAQHVELRQSMDAQFADVRRDIARIDSRLTSFYDEFRSFRDWVSEQFADVRAAIRQLTQRIERLERQRNGL